MEYLSGGQLKKVFQQRLQILRGRYHKHDQYYDDFESDEASSDDDELTADLKLTKPLFSELEISAILKAVLKGLASVHDLNYTHRDIKPENIILTPNPNEDVTQVLEEQTDLKIVDFGFSAKYKLRPLEHALKENIGTVLFMAPEQIASKTYGRVS